MKHYFFYIFILLISISSCKKDEDTSLPTIQITSPASGSVFSVLDTIYISANISDNEILKSASVYILDDKARNISGTQSFSVSSNTYTLNTFILLNDIRIESDTYDLVVTASDNYNTKKTYQKINLTSPNKELEKIIILTEDLNNTYVLEQESSGNIVQKHIISSLLTDAEINSYYNSLLTLSKAGNLTNLNISNYELYWENSNLNTPPYEYKGKLLIHNEIIFASQRNNSIYGYTYANTVNKTAISENSDYQPNLFCIHNDYIISTSYSMGIGANKIEKSYFSTGIPSASINLNTNPVEIIPSLNNSVFIFSNTSSSGKIDAFHLAYNTLQEQYTFENEIIKSVCKISNNDIIIATNLHTYIFNSESNNAYIIKDGYSPSSIFYEELNNLVYCAVNNTITIFTLPYFHEYATINTSNTVKKVLFKYNK